MELTFLGKNSFKFKTKNLTLIVDPVSPKERADVVVFSGVAGVVAVAGAVNRTEVFVIDKEGEYELGGVGIIVDRLSPDKEDKLVRISADGVAIADVSALPTEVRLTWLRHAGDARRDAQGPIVPYIRRHTEPYLAVL